MSLLLPGSPSMMFFLPTLLMVLFLFYFLDALPISYTKVKYCPLLPLLSVVLLLLLHNNLQAILLQVPMAKKLRSHLSLIASLHNLSVLLLPGSTSMMLLLILLLMLLVLFNFLLRLH